MNQYFYICDICENQYDEEITGMLWEQLPANWTCTFCGSHKNNYKLVKVSNDLSKTQTAVR